MVKKTHCCHGHEFTTDGSYSFVDKDGYTVRECKTCKTLSNNKRALQLRANHLKRKFGITLEEYDRMLALQNGGCAACGATEPGGMGSFHVDHCHITLRVRKLLCMKCNSCLGYANDDPERLEALAKYIRSYSVISEVA